MEVDCEKGWTVKSRIEDRQKESRASNEMEDEEEGAKQKGAEE